ncbi:hypothetical protein DTO164E3_769 [Paecilomyces variotii]|uniref:Cell wall protein n=1 Tax=Byssochlamys spectabilis TaxID=264951 RepID=A0A443HQF4_BYSSP|nr:hypothetical protein C8Q69DRAFT_508395 [Paecilomyces variotii]KAJ9206528.1 hypothetical protein DTO164E3_769 [Paecilomyces variotii]KAJ9358142.1 hypothetical protein DTO280E4_5251 [Paecilomyces variotii]KAJ9406322.1 hypothetical protein DTO045G8_5958 [Paecilomyces variotii]RWQ94046.1 hypothetical protein C8Q69DRAFT_508395 [Paecilomyces variotii]
MKFIASISAVLLLSGSVVMAAPQNNSPYTLTITGLSVPTPSGSPSGSPTPFPFSSGALPTPSGAAPFHGRRPHPHHGEGGSPGPFPGKTPQDGSFPFKRNARQLKA